MRTGITTDLCVHTTMHEANDRGFNASWSRPAAAPLTPAITSAAIKMIKMQRACAPDDVSIAVEPGAFHALLGDACLGQDDRPNATWEPRWPCWRASAERWREGP